MLMFKK